jgi:hypothetical protein
MAVLHLAPAEVKIVEMTNFGGTGLESSARSGLIADGTVSGRGALALLKRECQGSNGFCFLRVFCGLLRSWALTAITCVR